MAGGIDTSNRKPRRLRGTPALQFSNRASIIILGIGAAIGLAVYQYPLVDTVNQKFGIDLTKISEEEIDKRNIITRSFVKAKTGEQILQILKEKEDIEKRY